MSFKNKNMFPDTPFFTHFASLPLRQPHVIDFITGLQQTFRQNLQSEPSLQSPDILREHNSNLAHITFFKLILRHNSMREKLASILQKFKPEIVGVLRKIPLQITGVNYFTRFNKNIKCKQITVIYLQICEKVNSQLVQLCDKIIRVLLKEQIIVSNQLKYMNVFYDHNANLFKPETFHISLFRASNLFETDQFLQIFNKHKQNFKNVSMEWTSFDISTMKQYGQDGFYLPLIRIEVDQKQ